MPTPAEVRQFLTETVARDLPAHDADADGIGTGIQALFVVSGLCRIIDIVGEITTVCQNTTLNAHLRSVPTVGAEVALSTVGDLDTAAVGTMLSITGDFSDAMALSVSGGIESDDCLEKPIKIAAGYIGLDLAATGTGASKWKILWEPMAIGAEITAFNG